jgi:acetolactate synthase-1/2/3 large subunit
VTYNHHEQASAMAAEGYARVAGKPAIVCATTGPGALNTLNGVFGAYTDSVPMIVLAGQVKKETISTQFSNDNPELRQLGDQEVRSVPMVKEITKGAWQIVDPNSVVSILDKAFDLAVSGRPGPVWVEIPVDIQGVEISADPNSPFVSSYEINNALESDTHEVYEKLRAAQRPVILAGSGVRISNTQDSLLQIAEATQTPVVTAWTHDIFDNDHELFAGRAGSIGTRPGNFAVQNADLVLVLGSRLNIRQVSYNWAAFAKRAEIIWVDIDSAELLKPFPDAHKKICADLTSFLPKLADFASARTDGYKIHQNWISWIHEIKRQFGAKRTDYKEGVSGINPYHFVMSLFDKLTPSHIVVTGNATACIVPFQVGHLKQGMRLFSNSGSASMGFDLPAALGSSVAAPNRPIICLAGDGSLMMNIQELQTISGLNIPAQIFILNNKGYHSIRQTQYSFFKDNIVGCGLDSGLTFPEFSKIATAFSFDYFFIKNHQELKENLGNIMATKGKFICEIQIDLDQQFSPKVTSKKLEDGSMVTSSLEDMWPFLSPEELAYNTIN